MLLDELKSKSLDELKKTAKELGIKKISAFKKAELINEIIRVSPEEKAEEEKELEIEEKRVEKALSEKKDDAQSERGETGTVSGVLEVMEDGMLLNRRSLETVSGVVEPYCRDSEFDKFQFVRIGYFCKNTKEDSTFNRVVSLKSSFKI